MNTVVSGRYAGNKVCKKYGKVIIDTKPYITFTGCSFEVLDKDVHKSPVSAAVRTGLGVATFGPLGAFAGLSAKNKGEVIIKVTWPSGQNSTLSLDANLYKELLRNA